MRPFHSRVICSSPSHPPPLRSSLLSVPSCIHSSIPLSPPQLRIFEQCFTLCVCVSHSHSNTTTTTAAPADFLSRIDRAKNCLRGIMSEERRFVLGRGVSRFLYYHFHQFECLLCVNMYMHYICIAPYIQPTGP